jgi:hypothetical protein
MLFEFFELPATRPLVQSIAKIMRWIARVNLFGFDA